MAGGKIGQEPAPLPGPAHAPAPVGFFGVTLGALLMSSDAQLALADLRVAEVLETVKVELTALQESTFTVDADVPGNGFGALAADLDVHHARAHGVAVETLSQVATDLETFHTSIKTARELIGEADADAKARVTTLLDRADGLDLGHYAIGDAQVRHVYDRPDPHPEPSGGPGGGAGGGEG